MCLLEQKAALEAMMESFWHSHEMMHTMSSGKDHTCHFETFLHLNSDSYAFAADGMKILPIIMGTSAWQANIEQSCEFLSST